MVLAASFAQKLRFSCAAFLSMFAGSQTVHLIYRPLDGLEEQIATKEKELLEEMEGEAKLRVGLNTITNSEQK